MIVTLEYKNSLFDLQLPADMPVGELLVWILEYVNRICGESITPDGGALVLNRKEEGIRTDLTLEESGVRNGDYITVLNMNS